MRFQVPQFIETETKLVGPFTLRQFIYIGSGGLLIFMLQFIVSSGAFIPIAIIIGALAVGLAYISIDGLTLPQYMLNMLKFLLSKNQYTFNKGSTDAVDELMKK
ncbi:MAG: hypothetical protein A3A33_00695 [Candidatus Yanofskybacteria bacterium RIFCSPLOWO2_01_FULL_49_25]|uniref:PrgI family protein n=1 Tax=Candidatus Yanofskybacteria bacterium RIFCSPLOWO2_01_FULL_49_25 TaxID=1802701 RepID=A0A1F8GYR4_9BACT|nr:MAG: hypothetical protein A3A33_00695 [Candidatus Yanofskybacteria bacterium RIFCSPLOWO2_01_FULL_49_25]